MPIRKDDEVKPKSSGGIGSALDIDESMALGQRAASQPEKPKERKTAIIQIAVYPSWRRYFHVEAAKRGEKLAPTALQGLIDRYGLPDGASYSTSDEEE
jgi:hypothetical protein